MEIRCEIKDVIPKNEYTTDYLFGKNKEKLKSIEINLRDKAINIFFHEIEGVSARYTTLDIEKIDTIEGKKAIKFIFQLKDVNDFHFALANFSKLCQTFPEKIGYILKRTGREKIYNEIAKETSFLIPEGYFIYSGHSSFMDPPEKQRLIEFECNIIRHFLYRKDWNFYIKKNFYSKETTIIKKLGNIVELGI